MTDSDSDQVCRLSHECFECRYSPTDNSVSQETRYSTSPMPYDTAIVAVRINESCGLNETLPCTVSEEEEANMFSNDATRSHFVNKPKIVRQSDLADKSR